MIMPNIYNNITVVIVMFEETYELISKTLDEIKNLKLILIDNAGNKDLKKKISSNFIIENYILNNKNKGFSAGYNQGIKLSKTDYTLILNPDCIINEENIKILLKKILSYPDCFIISPTSYDQKGNLIYSSGLLPENSNAQAPLHLHGDICVESVLGACMLFNTKEIINNNLLFDENFFLYFSDFDLCRRIKNIKKSVIQTNDATCIHEHGKIKVKNKFKKIFIREYNFTFDQFYYDYKNNIKKKLIEVYKKKVTLYIFKFLIKIFIFEISKSIKIFARLYAYFKFKFFFKERWPSG